jgi:hypothetical protein
VLSGRACLAQVVELARRRDDPAAAALLNGWGVDPASMVLQVGPSLFAEYVAEGDWVAAQIVARIAWNAKQMSDEEAER